MSFLQRCFQQQRVFHLLALLLLLLPALCAGGEKRASLSRLEDEKEWKKLIKTKTNVLILFGNGKEAFSKGDLLGVTREAAEEIRGLGTIATVDCALSTKTRKLCKKAKADPEGGEYVMKHYHNGEFNRDYDRALKVSSLINFLKDPTGDLPWDEDETAQDVVHLQDSQALDKLVRKESGRGLLVMFYAPWCGFCKRMKPDYVEAAKALGRDEGIIAAIDVNKPENGVVRKKYNITGFPTLLYFRNGQMRQQYEGENTKDAIVAFMRDPYAPKAEKPKEPEWKDEPSEVVHLTTDTFDKFIKSHSSVLVMFFAPWCGHCKRMKPAYISAAAKMKETKIDGFLAAVDATQESALGSRFDVKGYPTVKFFKDGELAFDAGNLREEAAIIEFMRDPKEPPPPPPPEKAWSEEESAVVHLNEENFKGTLRKKKRALVMFYAPWCGHCKSAKPEFTAAAEELKDDPRVMYGAVDCTVEKAVCDVYQVKGFPTFKVFQYYNKAEVESYDGERTKSGFLNELRPGSGGSSASKELPPKDSWSDHPGHESVHMLSEDTMDAFLSSQPLSLIMFYAPWCGHCKSAKGDYSKAASILAKETGSGALAAVDCTRSSQICKKYGVSGYPTFQLFQNGNFHSDYNEGRSSNDFLQFMRRAAKGRNEL